jgi:hypothetical protein
MKCGICGKAENIIQTPCCKNDICTDEHIPYYLNEPDNCSQRHNRNTICGHHYNYKHEGQWQNCEKCKNSLMTEIYVWYGTNKFNFVKLDKLPKYELTVCCRCKSRIKLGEEGFLNYRNRYYCSSCALATQAERENSFNRY